jgi:hypothetical protein
VVREIKIPFHQAAVYPVGPEHRLRAGFLNRTPLPREAQLPP